MLITDNNDIIHSVGVKVLEIPFKMLKCDKSVNESINTFPEHEPEKV